MGATDSVWPMNAPSMLWVSFCLKLLSPTLLIILPMECFPLLSKPFFPLLAFPIGVKVGYSPSRSFLGMTLRYGLHWILAGGRGRHKWHIRNALREDVSGPSVSEFLSESSPPNSVSFPSVASYKRETNIKLLNPWTDYRISIYIQIRQKPSGSFHLMGGTIQNLALAQLHTVTTYNSNSVEKQTLSF
jgi:hypothetical protein